MADFFETVVKNYSGTSHEKKPTVSDGNNVPNGSRWREVDTCKEYHYNSFDDKWYLTDPGTTGTAFGTAVYDASINKLLCQILSEIRKMNLQISFVTDQTIKEGDIDNDY